MKALRAWGVLISCGAVMASVCDVCGKSPGFGNNISHSHRRTRRRWNPNIQRLRVMIGDSPKRINVCTKCLKANKVRRVG
jgi:large subunit ribosomal protein L28